MKYPADIIRRLHRILRQRADLRGQLERGPKMIKAAKNTAEAARQALSNHRDEIKKKRMEIDRDQLQLKSREAKIFDLEGKMNMAKKNVEYQTLKDQIAADTQANAVLSDEILEKLELIDKLNAMTAEFEKRAGDTEAEAKKLTAGIEERRAVLENDLKTVGEELIATEALLEGELKGIYQRLVSTRDEDAIAPLEGKSCGGCNTGLTPRTLDRLRMNEPMTCTSCGCLLIPPENPNVPR
jgi:predicted  nucleic acid-binding Zn-ribbon protein